MLRENRSQEKKTGLSRVYHDFVSQILQVFFLTISRDSYRYRRIMSKLSLRNLQLILFSDQASYTKGDKDSLVRPYLFVYKSETPYVL